MGSCYVHACFVRATGAWLCEEVSLTGGLLLTGNRLRKYHHTQYKLNKFHWHLSNDEGWRLEIPDLPELTSIGAKRCHDLTEKTCLLPQLGMCAGEPRACAWCYV